MIGSVTSAPLAIGTGAAPDGRPAAQAGAAQPLAPVAFRSTSGTAPVSLLSTTTLPELLSSAPAADPAAGLAVARRAGAAYGASGSLIPYDATNIGLGQVTIRIG